MRPIVMTQNGPVEGLVEQYKDFEGYSFKGIPYAADTSEKIDGALHKIENLGLRILMQAHSDHNVLNLEWAREVLEVQLQEHMIWKFLMKSLHWSLRTA